MNFLCVGLIKLILSYLKVIHLPKTPEDLGAVTRGFAGLARHHSQKQLDGCHVRIKPPSGPDGHCYRNRKLFSSIVLQAVCDHQGRFIDTYVGWPGSVHDSRVLQLRTEDQCEVWEPSASTPIIPGHAP